MSLMDDTAAWNDVFVRVNDKQYGPFSPQELRSLASTGGFRPSDEVWDDEDGRWVPATELRSLQPLFESGANAPSEGGKRIIAVGGGKGGVGKTVLTASLGVGLASLGREVVLVDADLGGANLHTVMGMLEPERTFHDFYTLKVDHLNDIALPTPIAGLRLISGACGTLGLANPKYAQKLRFIKQLRSIPADFILLDLGAGSSYNVIDFFLAADEGIVVTNPEPTAIQECFNFLRVCQLRRLRLAFQDNPAVTAILNDEEVDKPGRLNLTTSQLLDKVRAAAPEAGRLMQTMVESQRVKLILNMVREKDDLKEGLAIQTAAAELLALEVDYLGFVSHDPAVRTAVRELKPFLLADPGSPAAQDLARLISVKLLGTHSVVKSFWEKRRLRRQLLEQRAEYPELHLQAQAPICSIKCFYWDDCEYQNGGHPCSVRQLEPIFKS
ncbi:MAG: P-loop NTPase [candidate division KSB1 bacterium]|nr:P-loop NTPase [candidate division KSB1 bacterium]MDZ7274744.1 P-loop NTPase [candidate division KSB1 bacterium]MDZ7285569.1 P-loop NTPase [candidate division KSB1 bacterium]MDZ7298601.1 P-loop NTPase [candidate division KSB1 bacterium]MDZ7306780.1 P-loop NTPase [candidate division KSB1 bacterium]